MALTDNNDSVQVDFVCKTCRDGKHGCPGRWRGIGLDIRCTCICIMQAGRTGKEDSNIHHHNNSSMFTTTSKTRVEEIGVMSIEDSQTESTRSTGRTCELKPPSKQGVKLRHWNENNNNRNSESTRGAWATNRKRRQADFEDYVKNNSAEEDRGGSTSYG